MGRRWTTCKKCNRVLWEEDADENGLCEDCRKRVYEKPDFKESRGRKLHAVKGKEG
jgi:hypothetical protein